MKFCVFRDQNLEMKDSITLHTKTRYSSPTKTELRCENIGDRYLVVIWTRNSVSVGDIRDAMKTKYNASLNPVAFTYEQIWDLIRDADYLVDIVSPVDNADEKVSDNEDIPVSHSIIKYETNEGTIKATYKNGHFEVMSNSVSEDKCISLFLDKLRVTLK